jgi:hypothetical protein
VCSAVWLSSSQAGSLALDMHESRCVRDTAAAMLASDAASSCCWASRMRSRNPSRLFVPQPVSREDHALLPGPSGGERSTLFDCTDCGVSNCVLLTPRGRGLVCDGMEDSGEAMRVRAARLAEGLRCVAMVSPPMRRMIVVLSSSGPALVSACVCVCVCVWSQVARTHV